jgi:hypothetical protein
MGEKMRYKLLFLTFMILVGRPLHSQEVSLEENLKELNLRWIDRDRGKYGPDTLAMAKNVVEQHPNSYDAHWQYARAAFWACYAYKGLTDSQRQTNCKKSWDAGKQAIAKNPNEVEGHYFTALSIGIYAKAVGILDSVRQGLAGEIEKHAKRSVELDPTYDGAGPHRLLGSYYQNLPWPLQDLDQAKYHLDAAYKLAPGKAINVMYLAKYYFQVDDPENAKKMLEVLVDSNYKSTDPASYRNAKPKAEKMLKEL